MTESRFPRSRFLRRAPLAIGGVAGFGAGLRAIGGAITPSSATGPESLLYPADRLS